MKKVTTLQKKKSVPSPKTKPHFPFCPQRNMSETSSPDNTWTHVGADARPPVYLLLSLSRNGSLARGSCMLHSEGTALGNVVWGVSCCVGSCFPHCRDAPCPIPRPCRPHLVMTSLCRCVALWCSAHCRSTGCVKAGGRDTGEGGVESAQVHFGKVSLFACLWEDKLPRPLMLAG